MRICSGRKVPTYSMTNLVCIELVWCFRNDYWTSCYGTEELFLLMIYFWGAGSAIYQGSCCPRWWIFLGIPLWWSSRELINSLLWFKSTMWWCIMCKIDSVVIALCLDQWNFLLVLLNLSWQCWCGLMAQTKLILGLLFCAIVWISINEFTVPMS